MFSICTKPSPPHIGRVQLEGLQIHVPFRHIESAAPLGAAPTKPCERFAIRQGSRTSQSAY
jgi:hypothetical protein